MNLKTKLFMKTKKITDFVNFKLLKMIKIVGGLGDGGPIDPPTKPKPGGDDGTTH